MKRPKKQKKACFIMPNGVIVALSAKKIGKIVKAALKIWKSICESV